MTFLLKNPKYWVILTKIIAIFIYLFILDFATIGGRRTDGRVL